MTLAEHVFNRLVLLKLDCKIVEGEIQVKTTSGITKIWFDEEWCEAYRQFKKARSISYDAENRLLKHNNSIEAVLTKLSASPQLAPEQYTLNDGLGNTVVIGAASTSYALSFFNSTEYDAFFKRRVKSRILNSNISKRRVPFLFWTPVTATYTFKGRKTPSNLKEKALTDINRCLFKIAVENDDCFSLWTPKIRNLKLVAINDYVEDNSIPRSNYDQNVVSYYKVAKASPFPSQSFLAYYNALEYYFLRVQESILHDRLTAMLNAPSFHANRNTLDKVIATIRGQDARGDETEMLRNVLDRFVQESDLIEFILKFEDKCGEKVYSKKRIVFGEPLQITPMKDHALANASKVLKHLRNAIVHSTDRYKREDCHIPLSDSESIIEEFVPLVRFFAEKVIYGTAT